MTKPIITNLLWIAVILFYSCAGNKASMSENGRYSFEGIETSTRVYKLHGKVKSVEGSIDYAEKLTIIEGFSKYGLIEPRDYFLRYAGFDSSGMEILHFTFLPIVDDSLKNKKRGLRHYYHKPDIIKKTTKYAPLNIPIPAYNPYLLHLNDYNWGGRRLEWRYRKSSRYFTNNIHL